MTYKSRNQDQPDLFGSAKQIPIQLAPPKLSSSLKRERRPRPPIIPWRVLTSREIGFIIRDGTGRPLGCVIGDGQGEYAAHVAKQGKIGVFRSLKQAEQAARQAAREILLEQEEGTSEMSKENLK
jgi:hypothetical protein